MTRRSLLSAMLPTLGALCFGQSGTLQGKKAVICDGSSVKCPNGHETCREIDAPIAVGNDSYQNPEVAQVRQFKVLWCEQCHVLFAEKS